jgi:hypothetical protein
MFLLRTPPSLSLPVPPASTEQWDDDSDRITLLAGVTIDVEVPADTTAYLCYTYLAYVVPFFVGLHFTYLDFVPFLQQLVLTGEALRTLSPAHWCLLGALLLLLLGVACYHLVLMFATHILLWYALAVVLAVGVFAAYHWYQRRHPTGRPLHLHHYQLVAAIALLTPFQVGVVCVCVCVCMLGLRVAFPVVVCSIGCYL